MSADFDTDDVSRLLALEHAFYALALISADNFAYLAKVTPSAAVRQFRTAVEGSMHDSSDIPTEIKELMRKHLKRMFNHVEGMAKHADLGFE